MTDAEQKIWYKIRQKQLGVKFRRQEPIGPYIVDFICFDKKLIIEVDGGQHYKSSRDAARNCWFNDQGYKILRFWNNDVLKNIDGVIALITQYLTLPFVPSIKGGESELNKYVHTLTRVLY